MKRLQRMIYLQFIWDYHNLVRYTAFLMKRFLIVLFAVCPLLMFTQNKFGQSTVQAGVSYSVWRGMHKIPFREYDTHFKFTVGKQAAFDAALLRRLSIGVGFTYHKHILVIDNYQYTVNDHIITENPEYTVRTGSVYFRGLLHHKDIFDDTNKRIDLYGGIQELYIMWDSSNTSNDPDFQDLHDTGFEIPSLVGGVRIYPTDFIGMYAECSIPGAYTIAFGISVRIGGRERFWNK